jgi:response regulator NasT
MNQTNTPERSASDDGAAPPPPARNLQRILIAEDEQLIAENLAETLGEFGYDVVGPFNDAEGALEAALSDPPDLVLLDIRMPGQDGLSAAREIWNRIRRPIVFVSAYSDEEYIEACRDIGVFGYLIKPVDPDSLRVTISVAWNRYQSAVEREQRVEQLERNLANRRTVEQAKWKLVQEQGLSEPDAHRRLQATARNARSPLLEVAERVISGELSAADLADPAG